jgi:hypothetical protein
MAKRWNPPDKVQDQEVIGRRIANDEIYEGKMDQGSPGRIRLDHFMETRKGGDISLDRLGRSGVDGRVLRYLDVRCQRWAAKFHRSKKFEGWASLKAGVITGDRKVPLSIVASPDAGFEEQLDDNEYHAHIPLPERVKEEFDIGYLVALHLKRLYERDGKFISAP